MIEVFLIKTDLIGQKTIYDFEIRSNTGKASHFSKRFSDFFHLRHQIGVHFDFPSRLSTYYKNSQQVIAERGESLQKFSQMVLNDPHLKLEHEVLGFFNLSKSFILEDDMLNKQGDRGELNTHDNIDSSSKWMIKFKLVNTSLQDLRNKLFGGNIQLVDIKNKLQIIQSNLKSLKQYLENCDDISEYEKNSRHQSLINLEREYDEISKLTKELKIKNTTIASTSLNASPSTKRTLGKPKETSHTRQLNDQQLLQVQKDSMQSQDEDLAKLRDIIIRQKQMGIAINEELDIHNELLDELNNKVDSSERKLSTARNKINKIV